ncbi:hypothetical protein [uncultured Clostridium sp.]|uniref:hypothetical protein n=1 Tax=uncultured Clostridium sp. TaxID=59620 RepID=UPI002729F509|nr:hypothetical protein [uncultured Clostridium sp.]
MSSSALTAGGVVAGAVAVAPYALVLGTAFCVGSLAMKNTKKLDVYTNIDEMSETHKMFSTFAAGESTYLSTWTGSMSIAEAYAENFVKSEVLTDSKAKAKTKKITQKVPDKSYTVYKLIDEDDSVQYIGRTGDVEATIRRHRKNIFRTELELVPIHQGLSFEQSRGLEQYYIEAYRTLNRENKANNQINGVNPKKKEKYNYYLDIAEHYLNGETYVGG